MNKKNSNLKISVVAPSESFSKIVGIKRLAEDRIIKEFGAEILYGNNIMEVDLLGSSPINLRINDLHEAFKNKDVDIVICATGGYNSIDLLPHIDWDIIKNNPKPFIGSSDITVLINAIYAKTDVITYYGPNYFKFGMKYNFEYTIDLFRKCFLSTNEYKITPSIKWSEDKWYRKQEEREFKINTGYTVLRAGKGTGRIIGGNLCSLNLLQGTEYMPSLENAVLFIEDDDLAAEDTFGEFYRNLQSLLQQPGANKIQSLIIGRFLSRSNIDLEKIKYILDNCIKDKKIPIIANVDFGHTDPSAFFPIGGTAEVCANEEGHEIRIIKH